VPDVHVFGDIGRTKVHQNALLLLALLAQRHLVSCVNALDLLLHEAILQRDV
jgi:hypothetical protein